MNITTCRTRVLVLVSIAALVACAKSTRGELEDAAPSMIDAGPHTPDTGRLNEADTGLQVPDTGLAAPDSGPSMSESRDEMCERVSDEFESYLAQHQSCDHDEDCEVIGDCGPNADFRSVYVDVAAHAYSLMRARCSGAADGPGYRPRCIAGRCDMEQDRDLCCGCYLGDDAGRVHEDDAGE